MKDIIEQLLDAAKDEALVLIEEGLDPDAFTVCIDDYETDVDGNLTDYEVTIEFDVSYH